MLFVCVYVQKRETRKEEKIKIHANDVRLLLRSHAIIEFTKLDVFVVRGVMRCDSYRSYFLFLLIAQIRQNN